jgi:hypothetical protein
MNRLHALWQATGRPITKFWLWFILISLMSMGYAFQRIYKSGDFVPVMISGSIAIPFVFAAFPCFWIIRAVTYLYRRSFAKAGVLFTVLLVGAFAVILVYHASCLS